MRMIFHTSRMVSCSTDLGLTSGCPGERAGCPAGRSPALGALVGGNAGLRCMVGVDAPSGRCISLDCTAAPPGGPPLLYTL